MRRPGRIDLVLEVQPPNEETVGRMITSFAGEMLEAETDLSEVKRILNGQVPARVREVVNRAQLETLRRTGNLDSQITGTDLAVVGEEVKAEAKLFPTTEKASSENTGRVAVASALETAANSLRTETNTTNSGRSTSNTKPSTRNNGAMEPAGSAR